MTTLQLISKLVLEAQTLGVIIQELTLDRESFLSLTASVPEDSLVPESHVFSTPAGNLLIKRGIE